MSEFERGEQLNAIVRSWNPEAERLQRQIERAREVAVEIVRSKDDLWYLDLVDRVEFLVSLLSEDASDANETQDSEGAA